METALAKSRSAWEAQDRSTAALAVRAAEEALSQVDTLTEAVGKAEGSLRAMLSNLQTGLAQSEQDVAEAEDLFTKLMGDVVEPRREFIQQNALSVENLDT